MIRHAPFFDSLGASKEGEPQWQPTMAGLAVLRLVDSFAKDPALAAATQSMTIESARATVEKIGIGNPARAILLRVLQLLETEKRLTASVGDALLSYGNSLRSEARWTLAADVFASINSLFSGLQHWALQIDAAMGLGTSARSAGDWTTSDRAYAQARHLSDVVGDQARSLKSRVGAANSQWIRGNLPAAEQELDDVIIEARQRGIQEIEALALLDQAAVAHYRGNYQRSIHLGYRSLELTTDRSARDRVLGNIAAAYGALGMLNVARDGYMIVAATSPHQAVRSQAHLNLVDLAIRTNDERLFDEYIDELASSPLEARFTAIFMFNHGRGLARFGRDGAKEMLIRARDYAAENHMNQLAFEIEAELESGAAAEAAAVNAVDLEESVAEELGRIAEVLEHLREQAIPG
jgi:hypothetical protein